MMVLGIMEMQKTCARGRRWVLVGADRGELELTAIVGTQCGRVFPCDGGGSG